MSKPRCLIVDDETDLSELLAITLQKMGLQTDTADNLDDAKFMLRQHTYDICLTDMRLPDGNGLDLVRHVSQQYAGLPIAVITAYGSAENAVSALKAGAFDYLTKPLALPQLRSIVQSALKLPNTHQSAFSAQPLSLIGSSPEISQLRATIAQVSRSQAPVHLQGETGTGKELIARLIHQQSAMREGPFISAHLSGLSESQIEVLLFGQGEAGTSKQALLQAAQGGVLFIAEVTDLPLGAQVRLLQTIQDKKISASSETLDLRIMTATQRDLGSYLKNGQFRPDLYYRLNVVNLSTMALREIASDIAEIAQYVLQKLCLKLAQAVPSISPEALALLQNYAFPGNVDELESVLERALALCNGQTIGTQDIALRSKPRPAVLLDTPEIPLPDYLENIEKQAILQALEKTQHNKTAAAKLLGVSFRTLRYRLSKLGLSKDDVEEE